MGFFDSLFSDKQETKQRSNTSSRVKQTATAPWQTPYVQKGMRRADNQYQRDRGDYYKGDQFARKSGDQKALYNQMMRYGTGSNIGTLLGEQGERLSNLGYGNIEDGSAGLQNVDTSTGGMIEGAQQYADNPYVDGMIDAALRDSTRQLTERTLPGIAQGASRSGNTNSSRSAMMEAIAQRGYEDRAADVGASIRSGLYGQGANLYQGNRGMDISRFGTLGGQGISTAGLGGDMQQASVDTQGNLYQLADMGGMGLQADRQAGLDNKKAKFDERKSARQDALDNYFKIVGGRSWGGSSNTTGSSNQSGETTTTPSVATIAGGLLTGAGALPWDSWG